MRTAVCQVRSMSHRRTRNAVSFVAFPLWSPMYIQYTAVHSLPYYTVTGHLPYIAAGKYTIKERCESQLRYRNNASKRPYRSKRIKGRHLLRKQAKSGVNALCQNRMRKRSGHIGKRPPLSFFGVNAPESFLLSTEGR